jgi:hypothetical protein
LVDVVDEKYRTQPKGKPARTDSNVAWFQFGSIIVPDSTAKKDGYFPGILPGLLSRALKLLYNIQAGNLFFDLSQSPQRARRAFLF